MAPLPSPEETDRLMAAEGLLNQGKFTSDGQFDLGTVGLSKEDPVSKINLPSPEETDRLMATESGLGYQNPILNQIGKGLTLGFFDEIQAGEAAARNSIASLFGGGNEKSFSENYSEKLKLLSNLDKNYESENPKTAMALQFLGGLAPAIISGGTNAILGTGAKASSKLLAPIVKNVFGIGLESSPSIWQLAKMGAVSGAIAGAGQADPGERLKGAAIGGSVGSLLSPVLGKSLEKVSNLASDAFSATRPIGATSLIDETGAVSFGGKKLSSYTPEELILARQLKNAPNSQIENAVVQLGQSEASNSPLFLAEALNNAKVSRNARMVANHPASMNYANTIIEQRASGAADRLTSLFDTISDERNIFNGSTAMSKAADDILDQSTKAKLLATKPLYDAAKEANPVINSPKVLDLIKKDKYLQGAISEIKRSAQNADLPDNALEILIQSKGILRDAAQSAKINGESNKSRLIQSTLDSLHQEMESASPKYAIANKAYSEISKTTNSLEDSKLTFLAALHPDKIENIGQIFNLQPERIQSLRDSFVNTGHQEAFDGGIRAYLQNIVEKSKDGSNLLRKIIETPRQRDQLKAALGESYDKIIDPLLFEQKIFKGKQLYNTGSTTAGNLAETEDFKKGVGIIANVINGNRLEALKSLFRMDMPDSVAEGLAEIYFNPSKGRQTLERIIPLLDAYRRNKQISGAIGKGTALATTRADINTNSTPRNRSIFNLKKKENMEFQDDKQSQNADLSKSFKDKVDNIALNLGADPKHLLQVMKFETGGTLDPAQKNMAGSGATGLIQFMPSTAKELTGAESKKAAIKILSEMSPIDQLDYVEKYLKPFKGKIDTIEDLYMAVLYPKAVGKDSEYGLFKKGTIAYWQNRGLDIDGDGIITKSEAASKVKNIEA